MPVNLLVLSAAYELQHETKLSKWTTKSKPENNLCEIQEEQTYTKYNQAVRKETKHEPQQQTEGDNA